jgi:hypothetical protein
LTVDQDPNHVETVDLARTPVPLNPGCCRAREFALFTPVHGLDGVAEVGSVAGFDLYERDKAFALDDEIDVPVPGTIAALYNAPPCAQKPTFRYALAHNAEVHSFLRHGRA